ncbi:MAG: hypothetical protein IKM31_08790 [Oscillospiraceae bacterium]|nr:hypothetical protein [Oscillospiraceae bacterium]
MKKLIMIIFGVVLAAAYFTINGFDHRHRYSEEEKKPLPDYSLGDSAYHVTNYFSYAVDKADLIVEGEIITEGDAALEGTSGWVTSYILKIDRIWFGTYTEDTLTLKISGDKKTGPPKPYLYDQGVFLLTLHHEDDCYMLSASEDSLFIKNPPNNRIFSLSSDPNVRIFDGKRVSKLKKAIESEL